MFALSILSDPARADEYVLGAQDVLKIRVFEWRPSAGVAFEWVPLTGEFTVSPAGTLSLPIIGTVPVAGKTLDEVSGIIGEQLQRQVGLQKRPTASVEISTYRPFFVTGLVSNPGKYNYVPGLTVIQALSMAGGLGESDQSLMGLQRDALVNRGDLRELEMERLGLMARQARVDAFLNGEQKVTFPADLTSRSREPVVVRMMQDEQALFATRVRSMQTEVESLAQSKVLATNQLETLKLKEASLTKQIDLATKDLDSVNKLVAQGLTLSSRQLGANQNVADLESRNLDVSMAIVKTQQDLAKLDQDMTDVREKYRLEALTEAADLRDRLAANVEKAKTARGLLAHLEMRAPAALSALAVEDEPAFATVITRNVGGAITMMVVSDNDAVAPGDVISVERLEKIVPAQATGGSSGTQ
ncbi:polysaccharide biosynthesis/export family protein [Rhizobium sp. LC145]|uniref:polysaccharide biosynthesis/export family protein n=1 Tax=Rhizobium sp. LC145 TaxID=1120688 RepID=UPI0032AF8850